MKLKFSVIAIKQFYLFVFLFSSVIIEAQPEKQLVFSNLDGLPRNIITCIDQDEYGYLWIGTDNGVSRYDGNAFVNYKQTSGYRVRDLIVDEYNNLWMLTYNGLYLFNRLSDVFELKQDFEIHAAYFKNSNLYLSTNYKIQKVLDGKLVDVKQDNMIQDFLITDNGIWYSSLDQGVKFCLPNADVHSFEKIYLKEKNINIIRQIDDKILMGASSGQLYVHNAMGKPHLVTINNTSHIMEIIKVNDEIWVATDGEGVFIFDTNLNYKYSLNRNYEGLSRLNSNSIYDLYYSQNNVVWVASYGAGLSCLLDNNSPFKNIVPDKNNPNSLIAQEGVGVFSTKDELFLGTNYGMSVYNESNGEFTNYSMNKLKNEISGSKITGICQDKNQNYWLSAYEGLLGKYSSDLKLLNTYHPFTETEKEMQRIIFLHFVEPNNLIVGSHNVQKTLFNLDLNTETFTPIRISKNNDLLNYFQVTSFRTIDEKILLSVVHHGLLELNLNENILEDNLAKLNAKVDFFVNDFHKDKNNNYWFASNSKGLICISENGKIYKKWTVDEGLPTNSLLRIESVDDKIIWISTIQGICKFDLETEEVQVFNYKHGLAANEFSKRTSGKTHDGRIIFGSVAGFSILDKDLVEPANSKTEVIISDISFQNKSIRKFIDEQLITKPLEETQSLNLTYNLNSFTIHFFSKDKDFPKYNNYAYRLIGLEDEWIYIGENRHTTYTNLSPGTYTFEVKSTNKSNVWSNMPTHLHIYIKPPWYKSIYGYMVYSLLVIVFLYFIWRISINRIRLKKEVEMSEFKLQKEQELTERKLAFFTSISHDLKTPLTLIDAPVNEILNSDGLSSEIKSKLQVVRRNSQRLYRLINDLLDFRKISHNQLPLQVRETEIVALVNNIHEAIKEGIKAKSLEFEKIIDVENKLVVDGEKVEKILWNLVSNAIKYTPEYGSITLKVQEQNVDDEKYLKLSVTDTGIGIPAEDHNKIFDRFYQSKTNKNQVNEGVGIGLSIVKDLVQLHHGTIELKSARNEGAAFVITLPAGAGLFSGNEISSHPVVEKEEPFGTVEESEELIESEGGQKYNLNKLLIVEDNDELRKYLVDFFAKHFKTIEAIDGAEAFEKVKKERPDMVITDVVMPNMDGYELCEKLRSNFETSHLPIIMLTSNSVTEQQIKGLSLGADAYITKPFDINLLHTTVKSVLNNRKKIREKLMGVNQGSDSETKLTSIDHEFVEKLKECIYSSISDPNLNVDFLSEYFSISRTQLNRKIKSLTGQTPNNLIKVIKLKEAYKLIKEEGFRVSEAAYQTGFSDPNYFTICFKKEFGESPSKI